MARDLFLERTQVFPREPDEVFVFFANAWNLERITPAWLGFRIVSAPRRLGYGSLIRYRLRLFGVPIHWKTEIVEWRESRTFTDFQLEGPYPLWEHTHRFTPVPGGTEVYDAVRYRVPGGPLAPLVAVIVGRWLDGIFDYRQETLGELLG